MCIEVSIIVPVYNVEKYLNRCVESLLNQTYKNIEIILVNDASPDNSIAIMKEYEKKYPDIIKCIYLTKNVRQGGARNRGLKIAKGKFICFVDSDDWVDSDYIIKHVILIQILFIAIINWWMILEEKILGRIFMSSK